MPNKDTRYSISEIAKRMALVHAKALKVEASAKRGLLETSLTTRNLSKFLLSEAEDEDGAKFTEDDANVLAESIDSMKASLEDLKTALGQADNKFPNTIKAVEALGTEIPEVGELDYRCDGDVCAKHRPRNERAQGRGQRKDTRRFI